MDEFASLVLEIVNEIPIGKVASYSQIAQLAGYPKNARKVGRVLAHSSHYGKYPCFRVVHNDGSLVVGWDQQKELLEQEGVFVKQNNKVDMKYYRWKEGES